MFLVVWSEHPLDDLADVWVAATPTCGTKSKLSLIASIVF